MPFLSSFGGGSSRAFGFRSVGLPTETTVEYLVIAGGGGGGGALNGGGWRWWWLSHKLYFFCADTLS
jgi:hypothetical protein